MCSIDNSDLLQELWYKFLNSSFKNKSENLLIFLRSLYQKSIKRRNHMGSIFITSDISGIAIILIKQFLNDLENLYMMKDKNSSQPKNLRSYLESENGSLMLYGIEFIMEQIVFANRNKIDLVKSSVLKIILESELGNILATTLLSILTDMCLNPNQLIDKEISEIIIVPEFTFTHYLRQELYHTNQSKIHRKMVKNERKSDDYSTDEDLFTISINRTRRKPKSKKPRSKYKTNNFITYEVCPQSQTEIGELCNSEMEELVMGTVNSDEEEIKRPIHVITSLRIVTRLLHHIIPLDPSMYTDAISIYLEVLKSCCRLIKNSDSITSSFHHQLLKLSDQLMCNVALTVKILIQEKSSNSGSMTILLGHKVIDRLLQISHSFIDSNENMPLFCEINKLIFYILIIVAKQTLDKFSGTCRGIIHLFTCWHITNGDIITQRALNYETNNDDFYIELRHSRISLFTLICNLLSILKDIPDEKRKVKLNQKNHDIIFAHHSSQFNYIPTLQKTDTSNDICCYASICHLLLNNLVHLLNQDSKCKSLHRTKKQLYYSILSYIKAISFCCTIDLLSYTNTLVDLLVNPIPTDVKFIVIKFLQLIIEISFEFYKYRFTCDCQYTSRHDVISILQEIRNVCIPKLKDSTCPRQSYDTTFVDLLHFIDWLAKIQDDVMKDLVMANVTRPIFNRLVSYESKESNPSIEMIGSSIFSLLPYLNTQWEMEDLQLCWSVCEKYSNLKNNYYRCLTIFILSTRSTATIDFNEKAMKTRIIDYLIATVNFDSLMKRLDHTSDSLNESVEILLEDIHVWQCFRILFTYNHEFRHRIFENNGIDCCYVMLKQIIAHISVITANNFEELKKTIFFLFESLMCLVIDGNMLKTVYYYEGYSYEIIWTQLQSTILKFFPKDEIIAQQLVQSLLNCCFRNKWTLQNDLYQLRKLFLDSIISSSITINNINIDTDLSDLDIESSSSDHKDDLDFINTKYDADVSSDLMNNDVQPFKIAKQHDLRDIEGERANVFIDLNSSDSNGNSMEINTDFLRLFIKIVLSLPIENYHVIGQKALESVYNSLRFVPDKNQRSFICDDFMEKMMQSIENILTYHSIPGLQLILLKLLSLPYSCWCTASRLRFLISLSEKNPTLREEILKMLLEKAHLIQSLQPEFSIVLPIIQEKSLAPNPLHSSSVDFISCDKDDFYVDPNYFLESQLSKNNWKGLDYNFDCENPGFSVSMWIQMDSKVEYKKKKKFKEAKKIKKKLSKPGTPVKSQGSSDNVFHAKSSINTKNKDYVHIISLYSKDKITFHKSQCFEIWCKPSTGTMVARLYQRINKVPHNVELLTNSLLTPSRSRIRDQLLGILSPLAINRGDTNDPCIAIDDKPQSSFTFVGEAIFTNFLPLSSWNFLTFSVSWQNPDFGLVTWLLNGDVIQQSKINRNSLYTSNGGQNLETFVCVGQINPPHLKILNQSYNLGSVFLFEGPIVLTTDDNLSLMLMSSNWDGGSIYCGQEESTLLLATVIMNILIDNQVNIESAATLLDRGRQILNNNWVNKINKWISKHLVGSFSCNNLLKFEINHNYMGESELTSMVGSDIQETSMNSMSLKPDDNISSSIQYSKKYILAKTSLDSAFENLGGISILYFWLAKLVPINDHNSIRWLIKLILLLLRKSVFLYYQNIQDNGYSILFQLFKSFKMTTTYEIIFDLLEHMTYTAPISQKSSSQFTSKLCRDPHIIQELLIQWKIWATSKLSACDTEIMMTEPHALLLDKYLLGQINNLISEQNIYSLVNCSTINSSGMLSSLLLACQEPFEALKHPLPGELFQIIIQIITNIIPTPVDLNIVTKLCNTILQLYPVSMKDNDTDIGRYYRHLKAYNNDELENPSSDNEILVSHSIDVEVISQIINLKEDYCYMKPNLINMKYLSTSLKDSKVSDVEKKAMERFYNATLFDNVKGNHDDNDNKEIELSSESTNSESISNPTIIDENESNLMNTSFETIFITSGELVEEPLSHNESMSSRVNIITELISTLQNVMEVKVSDTVFERFSGQNFCFEFVLHLLSHSCSIIRHRSLSLFRVYLYQRRKTIENFNNQPSLLNIVAHVLHQYPASKEIIAETISIIFGQNLLHLIMDIDWNNYQSFDEISKVINNCSLIQDDILSVKSICKLYGIITNDMDNEDNMDTSSIDNNIRTSTNQSGLYYCRSVILLLSAITNVDNDFRLWTLSLCNWLFVNNSLVLEACIKNGLLECICNIVTQLSQQCVIKDDAIFLVLSDICVSIAINVTISSTITIFTKFLEMCQIMHIAGLKSSKKLNKTGNNGNIDKLEQYLISNIIMIIIKTIFVINFQDPAFQIIINDSYIHRRVNKLKLSAKHKCSPKVVSQKLAETINGSINIIIHTQRMLSYYYDICEELGLKLLNYSLKLISNCLACNEIPEQFSPFLSCKEVIKSHLGDLIVFLTHSKMGFEIRLAAVKIILKLKNFNRVIRYCLLGNSSGSICMIINIKQILDYVKELEGANEDFVNDISSLLDVVSLNFTRENIYEDSRNLWIKDCEQRNFNWKQNFNKILTSWNENSTRSLNELSVTMKTSYCNYRPYVRKNLQQEYISNIRCQRSAEFYRRRAWKTITSDCTQEKAIWNDVNKNSHLYRLDPTEGPSRIRRRLVKTVRKLDSKFFINDDKNDAESKADDSLKYLFDVTYLIDKLVFESPIECQLLKCIEDVRITSPCVWVSQSGHFNGEFFVGSSRMGFLVDNVNNSKSVYDELPNQLKDFGFISWRLNEMESVVKRRFKLRDFGLEIFMKDGRNCLIAMPTTQDRDTILQCIETFYPSNIIKRPRLNELQNKWVNGKMSNFDYLTVLNTAAGRSYNDIMQYPVFPFILTDYSSPVLDLTKESTFRDLSKPISIQKASLREKVALSFAEKADEYQRQMRLLQNCDEPDDMSIWAVPPHHYSSLYSNSATVLYYMVRIPPFTQKFIEFQDDEFDRPDRMFHTLESAYELSTSSLSCVKEIIPEFFYLPEMFVNSQEFNFGERLNGVRVNDVVLPEWCSKDARLFCLIHRAALESPYVSNQLSQWIDLIFGYKQTGKAALDAMNLFHPYTYYKAICPDEITENIRRMAVEQMIENYGQIPKQLFPNKSHSNRKVSYRQMKPLIKRSQSIATLDRTNFDIDIANKDQSETEEEIIKNIQKERKYLTGLNTVIGIPWGDWVGSPENLQTFINDIHKKKEIMVGKLFLLPITQATIKRSIKLLVIPKLSSVLILPISDNGQQPIIKFAITNNRRRVQIDSVILANSYGVEFQSERLGSMVVSMGSGQAMVTSIAIYQRAGRVFFGMDSGLINVYNGDMFKYSQIRTFMEHFDKYWRTLVGHRSAVTHLVMGESFAVLASCDKDTNVAIWDPQKLNLIHFIDWQSIKCVPIRRSFNVSTPTTPQFDDMLNNGFFGGPPDSMLEISTMCFSETLGDLVICRLMKQKIINTLQCISNISLFTINGKHVESILLSGTVISLSYTNLTEGRNINAIAAVNREGRLTVMSSWNLQIIWKVKIPQLYQPDPVVSIQYMHSGRELYVMHESGHVQVLQSNKPDVTSRQYVYFWL